MKQHGGSVYLTPGADLHGDRDFHYDISCIDREVQVVVQDFTQRTEQALIAFDGSLGDAAAHFESGPVASERDVVLSQVWEALGAAEYGWPIRLSRSERAVGARRQARCSPPWMRIALNYAPPGPQDLTIEQMPNHT